MSNFWNGSNGKIAISKMDDKYLRNAIKFCENNNMKVTLSSGGGNCPDSFWYEEKTYSLKSKYERLKLELRLREIEKGNVFNKSGGNL